jgi:hypothetical protein
MPEIPRPLALNSKHFKDIQTCPMTPSPLTPGHPLPVRGKDRTVFQRPPDADISPPFCLHFNAFALRRRAVAVTNTGHSGNNPVTLVR